MDRSRQLLAESFARSQDQVLVAAIIGRIGSGWTLEELSSRLECQSPILMPGLETYFLDGHALLTLHPPAVRHVGTFITMTQRVEHFESGTEMANG
jgi:hypothetical protein